MSTASLHGNFSTTFKHNKCPLAGAMPHWSKSHFTSFSSTSNTKVEFGGMTGGDPLAPYLRQKA